MRRSVVLAFLLVACGPGAPSHHNNPDANGMVGGPCSQEGATQCAGGNEFETCMSGTWTVTQTCPNACDDMRGCVDCNPALGNACNMGNVVACNTDGSFGNTIMTCPQGEGCTAGMCQRTCTADGVDLIYVVDEQNELLSFDPRLLSGGASAAFHKIGTLACNAGPSWSDWAAGQPGPATPFSMGVDRNAVAWVLYTSGEIFKVSTADATCIANSGYQQGPDGNPQNGMEVFGMGFVTDQIGGTTEKLFIGGGQITAPPGGTFARIDPAAPATATVLGSLPNQGEFSPELTGTGAAELFGFYPGSSTAFVQQIDQTNKGAAKGPMYSIPNGLGGGAAKIVRAWAFAQWGGVFYIFATTDDDGLGTNLNSMVHSIDKATGTHKIELQNLPYTIVGAGVSTCAPSVVN
jgi:hypothetical protein